MMIRIFPAASRYSTDHGWLQSNFSFSFSEYYDPSNTAFGPLRVFNDDVIQGHKGFGAHPHREMEIVTIVLKGELQHEDSTGHKAITTFGGVQRMSAGTGIIHSEVNPGDEPVHLTQMWFVPEHHGQQPSYETTEYDIGAMDAKLLPVVSNRSSEHIAQIDQDMTIYMSRLAGGESIEFNQRADRRIYLFVIEGSLSLNKEEQLNERDTARIENITHLDITSDIGAMFMLIDLP